jgi:hypothetical protein
MSLRPKPLGLQGWLPKPGLQFGGHWVLYAGHPATCHSTFIVRVFRAKCTHSVGSESCSHQFHLAASTQVISSASSCPTAAETTTNMSIPSGVHPCHSSLMMCDSGTIDLDPLSWPNLVASMRVAGQVGKRLLLAYLHLPAHVSLQSPLCLDKFKVRIL